MVSKSRKVIDSGQAHHLPPGVLLVRYILITGRISLTSPSIQPPYKIPAKRHSDQSRSAAKKEKRRGAISAAPLTIAGLPFLGPTRLADGLELEVFYATPIGITIRPGVRWRNVGSPALRAHFALLQLRQTTVSTRRIILLKNVGCNQDCLLATNEIGSTSFQNYARAWSAAALWVRTR